MGVDFCLSAFLPAFLHSSRHVDACMVSPSRWMMSRCPPETHKHSDQRGGVMDHQLLSPQAGSRAWRGVDDLIPTTDPPTTDLCEAEQLHIRPQNSGSACPSLPLSPGLRQGAHGNGEFEVWTGDRDVFLHWALACNQPLQ